MPTHQPTRPSIRSATGKDLAQLQALARRTINAGYRSFLGDEAVDWFIGSAASDDHIATHLDQGHIHCLEQDGQIVGFTILDGPTIDLMMIDQRHHRQGLGRLLFSHAEALLFTRYQDLRLESFTGNTTANAFYEACGWSPAGPLDSTDPPKIEYVKRRG
ncbi:GNAT family N-acetyltransferase [Nonomuraea sp. NPDC050643]|uniref:GNAT family N-acetyltransferase n=1 Tax=Nonomuraea sp. NPDC050643 TaxID=3155660 RepID=UPI0033EE52D2